MEDLERLKAERDRFEKALIEEAKLTHAERARADRLQAELDALRLEKAAPGIDRAAADHAAAELAKAEKRLKKMRAERADLLKRHEALALEYADAKEDLACARDALDRQRTETAGALERAEAAERELERLKAAATQEPAETMRDLTPEFGEGLVTVREWAESLAGVHVDTVGSWLWVTGDTRAHKDELKAAGFRYSAKKEAWYWKPAGSAPKTRRARYGSVDALKSHWSAA